MRWLLLHLISFLPLALHALQLIPYIQIDFAHYFKLAQCQAKCSEKYGVLSKTLLNDASVLEFFNVSNEEAEFCENGCQQNRRGKKIPRSFRDAHAQGLKFWRSSSADSAKVGTSPVLAVSMLCQSPQNSDSEFEEGIEGRVGLALRKGSAAPTRFIVQWKHRSFVKGMHEESPWITASIEHASLIKVEGMMPGVQYAFQITAIGPQGRLGDPVTSQWTEAALNKGSARLLANNLASKNGYDSENGVNVMLSWPRNPQDSCNYRVTYSNVSHVLTRDIEIDVAPGVLLKNLEFDSQYTVQVSSFVSRPGDLANPRFSTSISTTFTTFSCIQIHGKGSLNCAPEPVDGLSILAHTNGSVLLRWAPASGDNVLTYRVEYSPVDPSRYCRSATKSFYLKATASNATFAAAPGCSLSVRVTSFDLIGREAFVEHIIAVPSSESLLHSMMHSWHLVAAVVGCVLLLFALCLIRCTISARCKAKVNEKKQKLVSEFS